MQPTARVEVGATYRPWKGAAHRSVLGDWCGRGRIILLWQVVVLFIIYGVFYCFGDSGICNLAAGSAPRIGWHSRIDEGTEVWRR